MWNKVYCVVRLCLVVKNPSAGDIRDKFTTQSVERSVASNSK